MSTMSIMSSTTAMNTNNNHSDMNNVNNVVDIDARQVDLDGPSSSSSSSSSYTKITQKQLQRVFSSYDGATGRSNTWWWHKYVNSGNSGRDGNVGQDNGKQQRILVTGGAGFVGSHLVDYLMLQGHQVIVVDNFYTGSRKNVQHWQGHPNFELIRHDIAAEPLHVEVDQIYHLASPASPPHYMANPIRTIKANTLGTINMLGLARRTGAKFLFASTSEIYGDPQVHPQPETYFGNVNPIGPRACYDESKRLGEALTYAYALREQVNVRVVRIFNTYGPRMNIYDGRVVSNFIIKTLQGNSIEMYGNGNHTRSFQYVSDLVRGLVALMASNYTQPVNIGNPIELTVRDLAIKIQKLIRSSSSSSLIKELVEKPALQDDPRQRRPDISLAKRVLNWSPSVDVDVGLNATIKYFKSVLDMTTGNDSDKVMKQQSDNSKGKGKDDIDDTTPPDTIVWLSNNNNNNNFKL